MTSGNKIIRAYSNYQIKLAIRREHRNISLITGEIDLSSIKQCVGEYQSA